MGQLKRRLQEAAVRFVLQPPLLAFTDLAYFFIDCIVAKSCIAIGQLRQ